MKLIFIDADISQMFMLVGNIAHGQEMKKFSFIGSFLPLPSPQKFEKINS